MEGFVEGIALLKRHIDVRDRVDRMATAIRSLGAVGEDACETGFGDELMGVVGLVHVDCKVILFANASKINA